MQHKKCNVAMQKRKYAKVGERGPLLPCLSFLPSLPVISKCREYVSNVVLYGSLPLSLLDLCGIYPARIIPRKNVGCIYCLLEGRNYVKKLFGLSTHSYTFGKTRFTICRYRIIDNTKTNYDFYFPPRTIRGFEPVRCLIIIFGGFTA